VYHPVVVEGLEVELRQILLVVVVAVVSELQLWDMCTQANRMVQMRMAYNTGTVRQWENSAMPLGTTGMLT
jgi:hypothetical protein